MNRLLWVVAGVAVAGGVASAQPPAGKERTALEQEFFLGEPPRPVVTTKPQPRALELPSVSPSILSGMRSWLLSSTVGQLGVSPLVRPEVW